MNVQKIFRNPEVLWREEDEPKAQALEGLARGEDTGDVGTSVLFADGVMVSLNVLGTEIWKRCDGRSIDEIVAELTVQFEVEDAVLREDARAFLEELFMKDFIRYEDR